MDYFLDKDYGIVFGMVSNNGLLLSIDAMRVVAEKRGGKCLSATYKNNKTKLQWQCARHHEWWARPDQVARRANPTWCPECAGKKRKTRDEIAAFGLALGGSLTSQNVRGMQHAVLWRCDKGHVFPATPNNVKFGHWCPACWERRRPEVSARNSREGHARRKARLKRT